MSELIDTRKHNGSLRHALLANASLLVLFGYVATAPAVLAQSGDARPTVWIELGGQLEKVEGEHTIFAPDFLQFGSAQINDALLEAQRPYRYGTGFEGRVSIEPKGSDWIVSAALRYGRANSSKHSHYQTPGQPSYYATFNHIKLGDIKPKERIFSDAQDELGESHAILDFQAGKDVGLGRFGGTSLISAGVRFAQFTSRSNTGLNAMPIYGHWTKRGIGTYGKYQKAVGQYLQRYTAVLHVTRSTRALGPSVSWEASLPAAGNSDEAMLAFDWGINASVLFGRQKTKEDHSTTGYYLGRDPNFVGAVNARAAIIKRNYATATGHTRSRSVTIPNVGGFAGVSLHFPNAKVSLGYRADFFFNASDQGIDVRDVANRNFYGPFATISIGLGG